MRGRKQILALCMAAMIVVMPVSSLGSHAAGKDAQTLAKAEAFSGKVSAKADLVISTADELKAFATSVNSGNSYAGLTVQLSSDIVFDGITLNNLETIGSGRKVIFEGTFDGAGHSISGIVQMGNPYAGLFYCVGMRGVVKDLTIKDCIFRIYDKGGYAGGIAASSSGQIRSCVVTGCEFFCNYSSSTLNCTCKQGGIVAENNGSVNACSVADTTLTGHSCVGGIAGTSVKTIQNCHSAATVTGQKSRIADEGDKYLGGIVGSNSGSVINCGNIGAVSCAKVLFNSDETQNDTQYALYKDYDIAVGGIAGYSKGSVQNCYSAGALSSQVKTPKAYVGGLIGNVTKAGTVGPGYYDAATAKAAYGKGTPTDLNVSSKTAEEMKSAEFTALLNKNREANPTWIPWQVRDQELYPTHVAVYDIQISSEYGVVTCSDAYTYAGKNVTFRAEPNQNYKVTGVSVKTMAGAAVSVSGTEAEYSFVMPAESVSILVTYEYTLPLESCTAYLAETVFTYDGEEKKPEVFVKNGETLLKEGTDYTVTYKDNQNVGTGTATVTGIGNCTGSVDLTFTIGKAEQEIYVGSSAYLKTVGNKAFSLKAKLLEGNGKLTFTSSNKKVVTVSSDGKVTVKGPGYATIIVTAKENANYKSASLKVSITVEPKKVKLTSLTVLSKRQLRVVWESQPDVSGYIVEYSQRSDFKNAEKVTVPKKSKISVVLKNLAKGKKYYVRVYSYKDAVLNGAEKTLQSQPGNRKVSGKIKY